jgi:hypothetical protein
MPHELDRRFLVLAASVFVLLAGAPNSAQQRGSDRHFPENKIPESAKAILEQADQFELLSLRPYPFVEGGFHQHEILGRTEIVDAKTRNSLVTALEKGVAENHGSEMMCFNPRHGIHVTRHGKKVDFLICFECLQVQIHSDLQGRFLVSHSPQPVFDKVLRDAGITLVDQ